LANNFIGKILNLILILNLIILAVFSIFLSFIPSFLVQNIISSPFYLIFWAILCILIIIYPFISNIDSEKTLKFSRIHIPFLFFAISIVFVFLTSKSITVNIEEGNFISLSDVYNKMNLKLKKDSIIKLYSFEAIKYKKNNKSIKSFKSTLLIDNEKKIIEVNKPLKIQNVRIFQKSWKLGLNSLVYNFKDTTYDLLSTKQLQVDDNTYFGFYPIEIVDKKINYKWEIKNKENEIIHSGMFLNNDDIAKSELTKYNFAIVKEDYKFISIFEITYKPFNFIFAFVAVLFIFMLLFEFWLRDFIQKVRVRK